MESPITPDVVRRIAKEVFPGLTDEHLSIDGPDPDTGWCVTVRCGKILGFKVSCAAGSLSASGQGNHGVDVPLASLRTEDELHRFLEACRDSLAKNLEALLTVVHGPVHVLPRDEGLDSLLTDRFVRGYYPSDTYGLPTLGSLLHTYAEVARRRAAAAKPAGS